MKDFIACKPVIHSSFNENQMLTLLEYMLTMPSPSLGVKASKYPFVASEILSLESAFIIDSFFPLNGSTVLLDRLFAYLNTTEVLEPVLSGYWG
jgi:hypothetical protein